MFSLTSTNPKIDSFDLSVFIKILFLRISVTIEPYYSLLTVHYHKLIDPAFIIQLILVEFDFDVNMTTSVLNHSKPK